MTTISITPRPLMTGLDCFGIGDWYVYYRISFTPEQVAKISNFPWNEAVLNSPCPFHKGKSVRETHFAFVGVDSMSIMELQRLNPAATKPRFASYAPNSWYSKHDFATKTTLALRWYLMLKSIVPGSESKSFRDQKAMLPPEYEVPSAVVETAKEFLIYKKTAVYVNMYRCARTVDLGSGGRRVIVGECFSGVVVGNGWGDLPCDNVGVGASRKLD